MKICLKKFRRKKFTNSYTDLRIARTKEAIRDVLTELIHEKGIDSITVKDITTTANINRELFTLN